jgi:hypothetical protein
MANPPSEPRASIHAVLAHYGLASNEEGRAFCPRHECPPNGHRPSFRLHVKPDGVEVGYCDPCDWGADAYGVIAECEGFEAKADFPHALAIAREIQGLPATEEVGPETPFPVPSAARNGAEPEALEPSPVSVSPQLRDATDDGRTSVTIETLAAFFWPTLPAKQREDLLTRSGCEDSTYWKTNERVDRVMFPFAPLASDPHKPTRRYRTAHWDVPGKPSDRFRWQTKPKVEAKAEGLLFFPDDISNAKVVALVGGESDAITVRWLAGMHAAGLPGEGMLNEAHAARLQHVPEIVAVIETKPDGTPDTGAAKLANSLLAWSLKDRVRLLRIPAGEAKDARALFNEDPPTFRERWRALYEAAPMLRDVLDEEARKRAEEAYSNAGELPRGENIAEAYLADLEADGLVGEKAVACGTLLATVSSLGTHGNLASLLVKGASSGGKSFASEESLNGFPPSYFYYLSNASEKALYYLPPDTLKHKVLYLEEAVGLQDYDGRSNGLAAAVRMLQSKGRLEYDTVVDGDNAHIFQDGPTALVCTTTAARIHPENETRALSVKIDDSPEQTRAVGRMVARKAAGKVPPVDRTRWHAYFEWLRLMHLGRDVIVPFAEPLWELIELAPVLQVRMRRDITTLLNFVKAHALLHVETRDRDDQGRVLATVHDYAIVYKYLADAFSENVAATVSDSVRKTVEAVAAILAKKKEAAGVMTGWHASYRELADALHISRDDAKTRAKDAITAGYIQDEQTGKGWAKLVLGDALPDAGSFKALLPTPEELAARAVEVEEPTL